MAPRIVTVTPAEPREDRMAEAVEALRRGAVVAVPTETFYGLAADATNADAVGRLNRIKGKADDSPTLLLAADVVQVREYAGELPESFEMLAATFWPGPLTLVVPGSPRLPAAVSGGRGTVGIRVPGLALPRRLAALLGRPVTGVSANRTGEGPFRRAEEVVATFDDEIEMVLDGGATAGGAPSTVVDLASPAPRVVRVGAVPPQALEPFLPGLAAEAGP